MKTKFNLNIKDWQKLLVPEFTINAIYIEDRMVRTFCFDKKIDKITKAGKYTLPKGIIEEGILKKPEQLKSFFNSLKNKLWSKEKNVWVILSLPSANFFVNIINLPELDEDRFVEAIVFNTQMAAPLPMEESYFDWEDWGLLEKDGDKEIFVALGIKKQIDPYVEILKEVGFNIVAIEPLALSLARFNYEFIEKEKPILIIDLRREGIEFIIAEGKKLIFFDFDSWNEIFGKNIPSKITVELLKKHIGAEIPMLLNFYSLKRKRIIQEFIFLSFDNQLTNVLIRWINLQYQISPLEIKLPVQFSKASRDWFGVIGAALRGLIPRNKDTIISLAPTGTEINYQQNHFLSILSLWGKIIITVGLVMVFLLGLLNNTFFRNIQDQYSKSVASPLDPKAKEEELNLVNNVEEFNNLIAKFIQIQKYKSDWKEKLYIIFKESDNSSVNIKRVLLSAAPANNITIQGEASKKDFIVNFKDALDKSNLFSEISLPLSALIDTSQGVTFNLSIKI
jgi:hypothetical protein